MRSSLIIPKREILFSPMLSTFGGGSARGFNPGGGGPAIGEYLFETTGTHSFVVPSGVETACFLIIGAGGTGAYNGSYGGGNGGDLYYINDVEMNSGETWTIVVASGTPSQQNPSVDYGTPTKAEIGSFHIGATSGTSFGNNPSVYNPNTQYTNSTSSRTVGSGAYNSGGQGGPTSGGGSIAAGGGGAAGYSGPGGRGGGNTGSYYNPGAGTGGGGGGGGGSNGGHQGAGGGGVGVYGQGSNGAAGTNPPGSPTGGGGGSAGTSGGNATSSNTGLGGTYGGGGGSPRNETSQSAYGQSGAVRIIWGEGRYFPVTNVDLASSDGNQTIV